MTKKAKATDLSTAEEVTVAFELARRGAGAPLLRRLTGFGHRWVRRVSQICGNARSRKLGDLAPWLAKKN